MKHPIRTLFAALLSIAMLTALFPAASAAKPDDLRRVAANQAKALATMEWKLESRIQRLNHSEAKTTAMYRAGARPTSYFEYARQPIPYIGAIMENNSASYERILAQLTEDGTLPADATSNYLGMNADAFLVDVVSRVSPTPISGVKQALASGALTPLLSGVDLTAASSKLAVTDQQALINAYGKLTEGDLLIAWDDNADPSVAPTLHVMVVSGTDVDGSLFFTYPSYVQPVYHFTCSKCGAKSSEGPTSAVLSKHMVSKNYQFDSFATHSAVDSSSSCTGTWRPDGGTTWRTEIVPLNKLSGAAEFAEGGVCYIPCTLPVYTDGAPDVQVTVDTETTADTLAAGFSGTITSNYRIVQIDAVLSTAGAPDQVFTHYPAYDAWSYEFNDSALNRALASASSGNCSLTVNVHSGPIADPSTMKDPVTKAFDVSIYLSEPNFEVTSDVKVAHQGQSVAISIKPLDTDITAAKIELTYDMDTYAFDLAGTRSANPGLTVRENADGSVYIEYAGSALEKGKTMAQVYFIPHRTGGMPIPASQTGIFAARSAWKATASNPEMLPARFGEYYYSFGWFALCDAAVNGYETQADWESAVPAQRSYTHVGEEKMRDIVVNRGYQIANTEWVSDSNIYTEYTTQGIAGTSQSFFPKDTVYRGPIYNRVIKGSYEMFKDTIVDGKYTGGYSSAPVWGNDCMVYAYDCLSLVSRSHSYVIWQTQSDPKLKLLGNLKTDESPTYTNTDIFPFNTQQEMYEAYAQLQPGDPITTYTTGGAIHIRIADAVPNVVRNADGTIDGEKSTITFNEQGSVNRFHLRAPDGSIVKYEMAHLDLDTFLAENPGYEFLYVSCTRTHWEYTFASMYNGYYVPLTLAEYETGMVEDLNYQSILLPKQKDITKGFTATVAANYYICRFSIQLLDAATGKVLYSDVQNSPVCSAIYTPHQKYYGWHYDTPELDAALANLTNGSYRIGVSVLTGPVTEVGADRSTTTHYYDFTITDKAPALTAGVKAPSSASKGSTITVPVNVNGAYAAADVEIKFDADKLTYVSGNVTPTGLFKDVQVNKGIARITLVDTNASAGQLAELTFTAKEDISRVSDLITVKSAQLSTLDGADANIAIKGTDASTPCPSVNFADVAPSAWYHDAVDYALENKVMGGYNATTFGPNDNLSRAMVVQVLYNKEGQPAITGSNAFPDVKSSDWFNNAVTWASLNSVVGGYGDGTFQPNKNVSLQEVAVILWNYSGNPTPTGDASTVGAHDDWAANALSWAVGKGIFEGMPYDTVTGTATRAQTAQMLMNYLSK